MKNNISPETLARLNHTNNSHLLAFRKKRIITLLITEIYIAFKIGFLKSLVGNNIKKSYQRRNYFDKLWIIALLKEYRKYFLLSEGEGRKIPFWDGSRLWVIDRNIAPAVFALNKIGVKTNNSCEGNQNKGHSYRAYISTLPKHKLPEELFFYFKKENVMYDLVEENSRFMEQIIYSKNPEQNEIFVKTLNQWANEKNIGDIDILKKQWRI